MRAHSIAGELGAFPTQLGHEVLFHGLAHHFNRQLLLERCLEGAKGKSVAGAAHIGFGQGVSAAPEGASRKGEGRDKHAKRKRPGHPRRTVPGQESAGGGEDVPDILKEPNESETAE